MTSPHAAEAGAFSLPSALSASIAALPRAGLVTFETPLEPLARLGVKYGGRLWVKRDDLFGLGLGGNKVRKLDFYFGKAIAAGADTVLITGAVQSNYVRLAAAAAAKLGLAAQVQLEERVAGASETYRANGNVLLDDLFGAERWAFPVGEDETAADAEVMRRAETLQAAGRRPFVIPLSPDKPPLGAVGYILAAQELLRQKPDLAAVVVASGSGLTHSGLLFGLKAMGWQGPVHGICVRRSADQQQARIAGHCARLGELLGVKNPVAAADIHVDDRMLAPGYGKLNAHTQAALKDCARLEGLLVDPVYTARTFAGVATLLSEAVLEPDLPVAVIHTGGIPALFAYQPELQEMLA